MTTTTKHPEERDTEAVDGRLAAGQGFALTHLESAALRARLVPCHPRTKRPLITRWPSAPELGDHDALTRLVKLSPPNANPALVLPPGLLVVDVDPRNGGDPEALAARGLPPTLTVATPSGGRHYYFRVPDSEVAWPKGALGPGIDLLATTGPRQARRARYVLVPPACLTTDHGPVEYQVLHPGPPAPAPEWLVALARPTRNEPSRRIRLADIPDLEQRHVDQADIEQIAKLVAPHYTPGVRHTIALALAGGCAEALWDEASAEALVNQLCVLTNDDSAVGDRRRAVRDTYERLRSGLEVAGLSLLVGLPDERRDAIADALWNVGTFPQMPSDIPPMYPGLAHIYSAATLAATELPAPDYLIDNLLVRGQVVLLAGPPKGGKTTLLTNAVSSLITGEPFIGLPTHLAPDELVLWATEEPRDLCLRRIAHLPPEALARLAVAFRREAAPNYRWGAYLRELTQLAESGAFDRIALLVIDTLQDWIDIEGEEENTTGALKRELHPLMRFAERTNTAVVVVHHTRKAPGGYIVEQIRGASALAGLADSILILSGVSHRSPNRTLISVGRLSALCWEHKIAFDTETGTYHRTGGPRPAPQDPDAPPAPRPPRTPPAKPHTAREGLLWCLQHHAMCDMMALQQLMPHYRSMTLYIALSGLKCEGLVESIPVPNQPRRRTYRLTSAGRTYVEAHPPRDPRAASSGTPADTPPA